MKNSEGDSALIFPRISAKNGISLDKLKMAVLNYIQSNKGVVGAHALRSQQTGVSLALHETMRLICRGAGRSFLFFGGFFMGLAELFIIAVGLSMDACAVAICKGLSVQTIKPKHILITGLWFGGFQAAMPLIGFLLGTNFADLIKRFDHWIAFLLLGFIGANMIRASFGSAEKLNDCFDAKTMFPLAIATSIDALAVGVSFAFLSVDIAPAVSFIGVITFLLSMLGVKLGNVFGARYKSKAELAGGIILILMGTKILLEHLGVIG